MDAEQSYALTGLVIGFGGALLEWSRRKLKKRFSSRPPPRLSDPPPLARPRVVTGSIRLRPSESVKAKFGCRLENAHVVVHPSDRVRICVVGPDYVRLDNATAEPVLASWTARERLP